MIANLRQFVNDESGTATMEYALVLGLIILASTALLAQFGTKVIVHWTKVNNSFH